MISYDLENRLLQLQKLKNVKEDSFPEIVEATELKSSSSELDDISDPWDREIRDGVCSFWRIKAR